MSAKTVLPMRTMPQCAQKRCTEFYFDRTNKIDVLIFGVLVGYVGAMHIALIQQDWGHSRYRVSSLNKDKKGLDKSAMASLLYEACILNWSDPGTIRVYIQTH